ncbi:MAG: hypothetical protein RL564_1068, partial [Pseudomonadota bacterium]
MKRNSTCINLHTTSPSADKIPSFTARVVKLVDTADLKS